MRAKVAGWPDARISQIRLEVGSDSSVSSERQKKRLLEVLLELDHVNGLIEPKKFLSVPNMGM